MPLALCGNPYKSAVKIVEVNTVVVFIFLMTKLRVKDVKS